MLECSLTKANLFDNSRISYSHNFKLLMKFNLVIVISPAIIEQTKSKHFM